MSAGVDREAEVGEAVNPLGGFAVQANAAADTSRSTPSCLLVSPKRVSKPAAEPLLASKPSSATRISTERGSPPNTTAVNATLATPTGLPPPQTLLLNTGARSSWTVSTLDLFVSPLTPLLLTCFLTKMSHLHFGTWKITLQALTDSVSDSSKQSATTILPP